MKMVKQHWPSFLVLIVGLLITTLRITGYELDYYPGKLGDARFNMYLLEHAHQYFVTNTSIVENYWNAPFMYPEGNVITYSDNLLGTFPIFSIFRLFGVGVVMSFALWFVSLTVLNYLSAYFFIKWLMKDRFSAAIGAFIFAFSIALFSQAYHAQTFPRFAIPLAFWSALLFKKNLSPKWLLFVILLVSYQIYCGIYLGFMLMIPVGILLLSIIITKWKAFIQKIKTYRYSFQFAGSLIIGLISLLPLIMPYRERADKMGLKSYEIVSGSIPKLRSYFYPVDSSLSWDWFNLVNSKGLESYWNHQIFPGGIAWLSAFIVLTIILKKIFKGTLKYRNSGFLLFVTASITFLAFLNFEFFSFYRWVKLIPGFGSMQAIQRIINIELLFFALAAAYVYKRYLANLKGKQFYFFLLLAILVVDNYGKREKFIRTNISEATERVDHLSEKLKYLPKKSIISYEPLKIDYSMREESSIYYQLDAMLATQRLGLISINGYSATCPVFFCPFWREPNKTNRLNWLNSREIEGHKVIIAH